MNVVEDRDAGDECQCESCQRITQFPNVRYWHGTVIRIDPAIHGQVRLVEVSLVPLGGQVVLDPVWRYIEND